MKATAFSPHEGIYIQRLKTTQKHNMPAQHYHDGYEIYLQLDGKNNKIMDNHSGLCYTVIAGCVFLARGCVFLCVRKFTETGR